MTNPKEQILETVRELKEARAKATQSEWDVQDGIYIFSGGTMVADNNDDAAVLRARGVGGGMSEEQQENNVEFCAMAANKMDQLCEALEVCVNELENIKNGENRPGQSKQWAEFALGKAAELLAKGKE